MKKTILKTIAAGILIGHVLFFTGPLLLIILTLKFIFTPFGMGRMAYSRFGGSGFGGPGMGGLKFAFADKVRSMSEEDYTAFKAKMGTNFNGNCGPKN